MGFWVDGAGGRRGGEGYGIWGIGKGEKGLNADLWVFLVCLGY